MSDIWTRDTVIGQSGVQFDTRWDDASLVAPHPQDNKGSYHGYKSDADYVLAILCCSPSEM